MPATVQSSPKAAFVCRFPAAVCPVLPGPDVLGSAQGAGTHPSAVQVYLHQERGVSHILAGVKPSWPLLVTCCIVDFPAAHQPMFEVFCICKQMDLLSLLGFRVPSIPSVTTVCALSLVICACQLSDISPFLFNLVEYDTCSLLVGLTFCMLFLMGKESLQGVIAFILA
eukprot:scaffold45723_cov21-Tisochrysis_lutea.AAC.2